MSKIAIIDDDVYIGDMLEEVLNREGYETVRAYSGTEALLLIEKSKPDLVLLDLMLPGLPGEEVLPVLSKFPVIVVSAKTDVQDKVNMLMDGAADYLTKPFETEELLARIAVQLRGKNTRGNDRILRYKEVRLDCRSHEVCIQEEPVHLTKTEYAILKLLLSNPRQVIPKSVMLERISEETPDCVESSLKVHISNLRKKLRGISGKDYIEAVWGIGFKLREE